MLKAFRYRAYPTPRQERFLAQSFGNARYVYNWALSTQADLYRNNGKRLTAIDLCKMLTTLKKQEGMEWLSLAPNVCLQYAVRNMDSALTRFFGRKNSYPRFRNKNGRQRIQFINDVKYDPVVGRIKLLKIGWIKMSMNRTLVGKIKTVTLSKNEAGKYFISILVETGEPVPIKGIVTPDTTMGIDVGLKDFAVTSTGERIENPRHYQEGEKRLAALQRRLSRKTKGSKRREGAKLAVAKHHYRIACQRNDFLHKLTSKLVAENQSIVIEDLNVEGMLKNHCLAKGIQSVAWSEFFRQLQYKCEWSGKNLIRIGRFEPSSRMCTCGLVNKALKLSDRTWRCPSCGEVHDRDLLAARNIKRFGLEQHSGEAIAGEDAEAPRGPRKRQARFKSIAQVGP